MSKKPLFLIPMQGLSPEEAVQALRKALRSLLPSEPAEGSPAEEPDRDPQP
jgi:predicted RNase H-like HicB family nuclease